jgi:hypothetical protein
MRTLIGLLLVLTIGCSSRSDPQQQSGIVSAPAPAPALSDSDHDANTPADMAANITRLPAPGSISGTILFPADAVPAMRICAIHGSGDLYGCVHTDVGATSYRIEQLPPTTYQIVAKLPLGNLRAGGFVKQVQCIRAPCPAMLVSVNVAPGEAVAGADLNGFYDARKDFPALPADAR